jgi:hypothetical protein
MSGEVALKDEPEEVDVVIVRHDVGIDPIHTDPDGLVRGPTAPVNGTAVVETADFAISRIGHPHMNVPEILGRVLSSY